MSEVAVEITLHLEGAQHPQGLLSDAPTVRLCREDTTEALTPQATQP